ncbi:Gfo/Idh/MocA family protein [Bradyrhizobium canariense]|uniref:Predicted dehydrogenase n=1 Tax=Bradyrhizobium canariense TaxID=255045 RepID=A0A1H1QF35_9BRAD|nr:Gfo/Idh/MocA family oxidoreductase [Bradyrhizobium canariense]SDS22171.1 Predicted dehydrogenase [Bradyrhizobium canariense]
MTTGIGIIGAGMVGQMCHLANFVTNPACRVVAIADLRPELAAAAATKFGVPRIYRSHREMLGDSEVTGVVVVTRRSATGPIVLDALNSGRHVLSEKPMAYTTAQATILVDAARQRNLVYSVGYMKRHDAGVAQAMLLLERLRRDGSLGRIVRARGWCLGGATGGVPDSFVMTAEQRPDGLELWRDGPDWMPAAMRPGYDTFLNVFSHIINLARYVLGASPTLVESNVAASNAATLTLNFGGIACALELSNAGTGAWREGLEIAFERGALTIELPAPFVAEEARVIFDDGGQISHLSRGHSWSFQRQAEAFVSDIVGNLQPLASGEDSVTDIALAEATWKRHAGD